MIHRPLHLDLVDADEFGWIAWVRFNSLGCGTQEGGSCSVYRIGSTKMDYGRYTPTFDMSELWDRL